MKAQAFTIPHEMDRLISELFKLPKDKRFTVKLSDFKRSVEQNAVAHGWYALIARTLKEDTPEGVKRECKLTLGVPILRGDDADFCAFYDKALKGLSYERKLESMKYLDVTSLMTVSQMQEYMRAMQNTYAGKVDLRFPNEPPMESAA